MQAWLAAFPLLKDTMDLFFGRHPKSEREVQQQVVRENNSSGTARSTDYFFCDLEYANDHGRFDLIAVHWPSTSGDRKEASGRRLVLGELKYGEGALDGVAGLAAHVRGVNEFLADPARVAALKSEMRTLFNQKRALGLIECDKDLASFGDEPPILLLMLANHDPGSSKLREILPALPPSPHADLRIAVGGVLGYALYDPAILPLAEAQIRLGSVL